MYFSFWEQKIHIHFGETTVRREIAYFLFEKLDPLDQTDYCKHMLIVYFLLP